MNIGHIDRLVKSRNGTKGVLEVCNSKNTKHARNRKLKESKIRMAGCFQGTSLPPMLRASTKVAIDMDSAVAPGKSKLALSEDLRSTFADGSKTLFCVGSGGNRTVKITAMAPTVAMGNSNKNVLVLISLNNF